MRKPFSLFGKSEERTPLRDPGVNGRVTLKLILHSLSGCGLKPVFTMEFKCLFLWTL
jgi:hypothetical protein